ncbi:exocyst complex component EXO70H1-like [Amaranthus tricolor]|uniref:exocyst complex component EXO70H1-like n=1 Tax=Amaranthus tricolor TaxID=29722 RepID=UPI00258FC41B|nr:exocyst complex component EXO70H1-like [Amaranthus tricolor]
MEATLDLSMKVISSWDYETSDISPNTSLFNHHTREEVLEFMRAVKDLHGVLLFYTNSLNNSSINPSHKKIAFCQNLLRIAKKRLSSEFYSLLKTNSKHNIHQFSLQSDHQSSIFTISNQKTRSNSNGDNYPINTTEDSSAIADLKLIADCMMSAGFGKKCLKIYKLTRRSFVDDALLKMETRRLKKAHVQKLDWETIDLKMKKWLKNVGICMKIFSHEKLLCENLFSSGTLSSVTESCFSEVCKEGALILIIIPGKLAKHAKKSPDKMFNFLQLYDGLYEYTSEIDRLFSSDLTSVVRLEFTSSLGRISDSVKLMLAEFESSVNKDTNKAIIPGGGAHPLTKYVINYLIHLADHSSSLEKILIDYPVSLQSPLPESYFEGKTLSSPLALQFGWLILVLLGKLDNKSELYKDVALSYLFLANNLQYVVKKVKCTKLYNVLGEKWVNKHGAKVIQYAANYERMGWGRVISALPKDLTVDMSLDQVKESFKRFNVDFEEEYRKEVDWIVQDTQLRDEMKASIIRKVDARYRKMYDKYKVVLAKSRERGKIDSVVKFSPEDLENYLCDLLDGHDEEGEDDLLSIIPQGKSEATSHEVKENPVLQRRSRRLLLLVRQHHYL